MDIPIELLIEEERKRKELEAEAERPQLQLEIPVPDYRTYHPEIDDRSNERGVIVVDSEAEERRGVVVIQM